MAPRIVVTGASGTVGTALLRRLTAAGRYDVLGVVRRPPAPRGAYESVTWQRLDLADPDAPLRLRRLCDGADCVVHLAWTAGPTRDVDYLYRATVGGTTALVTAAHHAGVPHFVHMSSVATYAAGARGRRVDESWSTAGIDSSVYSRTKSAAETLLDDYDFSHRGRGMTVARLRPGVIVGRDAPPGRVPVLPLDRSFVAPVVHAEDVADAVLRVIERRAAGPFNLAAEPPLRPRQLAEMLRAKTFHVPAKVLRPVVRAGWRLHLQPVDPGWFDLAGAVPLLDTGRARAELNWTPRWNARGGELDRAHATASPAPLTP
jgi:UDP-glucose 4-epimerase